ncbi:hypothetical protein XELAEV_18007685mg [Xenopus laevis]|uniref:Uncharacterized protein n=1 Tax=Xenopus laevis TaxID=8355 RepID=A0A974E2D2_XENLA|nr:hypothetical protein XELAEV_18007685mg [Xenopus laevis]
MLAAQAWTCVLLATGPLPFQVLNKETPKIRLSLTSRLYVRSARKWPRLQHVVVPAWPKQQPLLPPAEAAPSLIHCNIIVITLALACGFH